MIQLFTRCGELAATTGLPNHVVTVCSGSVSV